MLHGPEARAYPDMNPRSVVYALAALWGVLMLVSFGMTFGDERADEGVARFERMATFMTWQMFAFLVAIASAAFTRVASARGAERIKLAGYLPLTLSVFIVGALVAMIAFRVLVQPAFA